MTIDASGINLEQLRERLRRMSDVELRHFGRSATFMCGPKAKLGSTPPEVFIIQLEEARAEWRRRRNPKNNSKSGSKSK